MQGYDVTIFGLELTLKPVAFTLPIGENGWDIYWYGIIIALGFLLALVYALKNAKRFKINTDRMLDAVLVTTPLAILCARIYYVLFDGVPLEGIKDFFGFGESKGFSGIAIYGGVIGAFVVGAIMCKLRKINILDMFDMTAIGFLIGQGIGRWGNFINQEAYGSFTGSDWWGMESSRTISEMGKGMVHPCFLYESIWCIAGFFLIHHLSKKRKFKGECFLMYGAWYGAGRAVIELLRTDSLLIGRIKVSCLLSVLLSLVSIAAIIYLRHKVAESSGSEAYSSIFGIEDDSAYNDEEAAKSDSISAESGETDENSDTVVVEED